MVTISNTMEKQHTSQDTFQKILDIVRLSLSSQKAILANSKVINSLADRGAKIRARIVELQTQLKFCENGIRTKVYDSEAEKFLQYVRNKKEPTSQESEVMERIINRPNQQRHLVDESSFLEECANPHDKAVEDLQKCFSNFKPFKPNSTTSKPRKKPNPRAGYDAALVETMGSGLYDDGVHLISVDESLELQIFQKNLHEDLLVARAKQKLVDHIASQDRFRKGEGEQQSVVNEDGNVILNKTCLSARKKDKIEGCKATGNIKEQVSDPGIEDILEKNQDVDSEQKNEENSDEQLLTLKHSDADRFVDFDPDLYDINDSSEDE